MKAGDRFALVRQGRTWGVADTQNGGRLVEGGFFSRAAAVAAVLWWNTNAANFPAAAPGQAGE